MKKLAVANGQYQNSVGETKTRWVNVGVIGVSQNGKEYMLIDPTINFAGFPREEGKDMVMVGMFEETQQGNQPQQHQNQTQQHPQGYGQQQNYQAPQQQQVPQGQPQQNQVPTYHVDKDGNPIPQ